MASGEQSSPLKSRKATAVASTSQRNDSENPWVVIPNNLELGARAKPSKKQRNKEKCRQVRQANVAQASESHDSQSCKPKSSFHSFPQVKSNTATWVKDQFMSEKKGKRRAYESEEDYSDPDYHHHYQQNVHFPVNHPEIEQQEIHAHPVRCAGENENVKSVQDEFKKKEAAMVCEILSHIHEFISEAESSWQKLDLSDEPIIKDAFVKLKNAVKDVESGREKRPLHQDAESGREKRLIFQAIENGFGSGLSSSSSISRISNSKENVVNRDISGNAMLCIDDEQDKCNHHHEVKNSEEKTESISSDDESIRDVAVDRETAIEYERQKLKNKLVELQEEKKIKDDLLRELYYLKDAAASTAATSGDAQLHKTKEKKKKKVSKLQPVSQHVKQPKGVPMEDNQNVTLDPVTPVLTLETRHPRSSTSLKRDNVRKEQNSSFPARRHYEAEGRANEEPDIPSGPVPSGAAGPVPAFSPAPDNGEIHDKIKKLKVAQQHVKVIKDIVVSILESKKAGAATPADQLRLLTSRTKADQYFSQESEEGSDHDKEFSSAVHLSSSEPSATNVKDVYSDGIKSLLEVDSHRQEESEEVVADNLETAVGKKEDLTKLHSQFHQLMQIFPLSDHKNDDPVRSSGEGAYTLRKIPTRNIVSEHAQKKHSLRTVPHQDNLQLTRQNIANMESQSQNSNLHNRDCNSVKKDNINNLSGKMGKLSIQNSMNSSYPDVLAASNNNMDSTSIFSYELNQSHNVPNEVERKNIFDILKRDKKKQKQYDRNQDNKICCNSSIDSEPFEGSNSALAFDSTTLGAWGGSSTQENFEDDNEEQGESIEEQDEEDEFGSVFEKVTRTRTHPSIMPSPYSNMQQYIDSVVNIPDKKQRNSHNPSYSRNQNQPSIQSGFHQHSSQEVKTARQRLSSASAVGGPPRDVHDNATCSNDATEHTHQQLPPKFIQQLLSHVDQLNALCQNQIYHERPQGPNNSLSSQSYGHMPNTCTPLQPSLEVPFPYNQQLLLCLSQCYHALYMQQLEIHHLQRCMWQNIEGENSHQQNHLNARSGHEDASFRPYCAPSWSNPFIPSSHFLPEQVSPVSSAPYFHLPMKHYTNHNTGTYTASGTQPARAVIHPTSQNNTSSQETLNNQVPPRTRANNFWDNFRSYSRQNLLSTSNTAKRNENVTPLVTPQVRQVYPLVTNITEHTINQSSDASNSCRLPAPFTDIIRTLPNHGDIPAKNIKFNTSSTGATGSSRKDVPSNVNSSNSRNVRPRPHRPNLESSLVQPSSNYSTNLSQQQSSLQESSKSGSLNTDASNSASCPVPEASAAANASPEITSMLSSDHKSDFLIGLLHEAQSLKSEALRQKAIKMIRDLAMSEKHDVDEASQSKVQSDSANSLTEIKKSPVYVSNQRSKIFSENTVLLPDTAESEKTLSQLPFENASGSIQTLPTAAIPPLNKHSTPKTVSTGAVRKKTKIPTGSLSESASNSPTSLHESGSNATDNTNPPTALPPNKTVEDVPGFITEKVIADLSAVLPSLKRRLLRDGCTQTFWTFINDCLLESLRTHLFFCNLNLSRKSLFHLRQTVYLFLSLFSGITLSDMDSDFLKYVEEFIYENISCYIASGQFAPVPSSLDEENVHMGIDDKVLELCVKMPSEPTESVCVKMSVGTPEDPTEPLNVKMPVKMQGEPAGSIIMKESPVPSEENNFSPQCAPIQLQNLLSIENFIPEALATEPEHVEDLRCDCNPEAEIEPEVETGTEADLAEADQSPGQQGSGVGEAVAETWSLDHEIVLHRGSGAILLLNGDEARDIGDPSESAAGIQMCSDVCLDQEAILDDIPTKLCASEEELPQQLKDEQLVQLPSDDAALSQSEFSADNNEENGLTTIR